MHQKWMIEIILDTPPAYKAIDIKTVMDWSSLAGKSEGFRVQLKCAITMVLVEN